MKSILSLLAISFASILAAANPPMYRVQITGIHASRYYARPYSMTGTVDSMGVYSSLNPVLMLPADEYIIYANSKRIVARIQGDTTVYLR